MSYFMSYRRIYVVFRSLSYFVQIVVLLLILSLLLLVQLLSFRAVFFVSQKGKCIGTLKIFSEMRTVLRFLGVNITESQDIQRKPFLRYSIRTNSTTTITVFLQIILINFLLSPLLFLYFALLLSPTFTFLAAPAAAMAASNMGISRRKKLSHVAQTRTCAWSSNSVACRFTITSFLAFKGRSEAG